MLLFIAQCIFAYAIASACWRFLRFLVVKTDLDNVPGPPSHSLLKGNFFKVFATDAWDFHTEIRQKFGRTVRINAVLGERQLYVSDPKAIQHIIVKDQDIFEETDQFIVTTSVLFGKGILSTLGDHHRKQRKMLNPVFSIAHMRQMIPIFYEVTHKLRNTLKSKLKSGPQEIDVMHWITRTALELILQSGLGHSIDSLADDADLHPYTVAARQLTYAVIFLVHEAS